MKKLFTLAAAVLASISVWSTSYIPTTTLTITSDTLLLVKNLTSATWWRYANGGSTTDKKPNPTTWDSDFGTQPTSNQKTYQLKADGGVFNSNKRVVHIRVTGVTGVKVIGQADEGRGFQIGATEYTTTTTESTKMTVVAGTSAASNPTSYQSLDKNKTYIISIFAYSSDVYLYGVYFTAPSCMDPNVSIISDKAGYAGDAIDLEYSSDNTNEVTFNVKKGSATAVENTDYEWEEGNFKPLVAGTFVITATQAKDEATPTPHCAVEDGDAVVTLTIGEKSPVESVTIADAAHSARIGGSVELSATAANATEYQWFLNDEAIEGAESASYTFNATAAGTYSFVCKARNDFNSGTWVASAAHVITVAVGTDAKLSALSVAGKTLTPAFNAATLEYAIGEIGVYETPNVTATAADAPYAEVAVVDNKTGVITISVTAEDNTTKQDYVVNYTRKAATELVAISESTTWDWSKAGGKAAEFTDNTLPTRNEWFNFADVLPSPDESFKAASLEGQMQFANRDNNSYAQGYKLRFNTTVPGKVSVQFCNTGKKDVARNVYINGVDTKVGSKTTDKVTAENIAVPAGVVLIEGMEMLETPAANMLRFYKVIFTKSEATAIFNTSDAVKAQKRIENGQLVIEKNGQVFNAMGQTIR